MTTGIRCGLLPLLLLLLVVAAPGASARERFATESAQEPTRLDNVKRIIALSRLGLDEGMKTYATASTFGRTVPIPFGQRLVGAQLHVTVASPPSAEGLAPDILGLDICLDDRCEALDRATLLRPGATEITLTWEPEHLLEAPSGIRFSWKTLVESQCTPRVEPGSWAFIAEAWVHCEFAGIPFIDERERLPAPFLDPSLGRTAVQLAFLDPPSKDTLRAAARIVDFFAGESEDPVRIDVLLAPPRQGHAVVLDSGDHAQQLGWDVDPEESISVIDYVGTAGERHKILLIRAGTDEGLVEAAAGLAAFGKRAPGYETAGADVGPCVDAGMPCVSNPSTLFAELTDDEIRHEGHQGASLSLQFGVAPHLLRSSDLVPSLTIQLIQRYPEAHEPAHVDVELNGQWIGTLDPSFEACDPSDEVSAGCSTTWIWPRKHLLGSSNEITFHFSPLAETRLCHDFSSWVLQSEIALDSTIQWSEETDTAEPGLAGFVSEGLPFTRSPDLAQTTVILADEPTASEISTALNALVYLLRRGAESSGGLEFIWESEMGDSSQPSETTSTRHQLVVATADHTALITTLIRGSDLAVTDGVWHLVTAEDADESDDGRYPSSLHEAIVQPDAAVILAIPPGPSSERQVLVLSANTPSAMPCLEGLSWQHGVGGQDLWIERAGEGSGHTVWHEPTTAVGRSPVFSALRHVSSGLVFLALLLASLAGTAVIRRSGRIRAARRSA